MTNNDELALKLKAAAERATRGKWENEGENIWYFDDGYTKHLMYTCQGDDVSEDQDSANTRYVATANPANILALLAERDADKKRIAEMEALTAEQDKRLVSYAAIATKNASEARTVSVKLPRDITHVTNKYFEEGRDAVLEAIESQLAAAGIKLEVGE